MFDRIFASLLLASLAIVHVQSAVIKVTVGNGGFVYRPNVVNASKGDTVMFEFFPTNHSVYRAVWTDSPQCPGGYCNPCVPSNLYFPKRNDFFFSGLMEGNLNNPPTWNLTINDTAPIFFSCNAPGSCHPNGMVGVINPNASTTIDAQISAAKQAQYQLSPGDKFPSEGEPTSPSSGSSSSSTPTPTGSSSNSGGGHHSGLSGGAIAGIVVGCVAGVAILGVAIFFWARSRTYGKIFSAGKEGGGSSAPGGGSDAGGVGAWVAGQQQQQQQQQAEKRVPPDTEAQRQSYQTVPGSPGVPGATGSPIPPGAPSPRPEDGAQFVGYNRQSAQPEYAFEAPGIDHQINELRTSKSRENIPEEPRQEKPESPSGRVELP